MKALVTSTRVEAEFAELWAVDQDIGGLQEHPVVAILDGQGVILETHDAWQKYARKNGMRGGYDCVGRTNFAICQAASDAPEDDAGRVTLGIRQVMHGELEGIRRRYRYRYRSKNMV